MKLQQQDATCFSGSQLVLHWQESKKNVSATLSK
jgi:hypothetical protein